MAWNSYPGKKLKLTSVWHPTRAKDPTSYALQRFLRRQGYYTTAYALDGHFGVYSIRAWQRFLRDKGIGTGPDGGKYTGLIDGFAGPMTVRKASLFLTKSRSVYTRNAQWYNFRSDWTVDSVWPNYNTTRAWQRFLNDHRW